MKLTWRTYVTVLLLALVIGVFYGSLKERPNSKAKDNLKGTLLSQPRALEEFSLTDDNNTPFTNENLKGKWSFLFFGFTRCHSICPTTLAEMRNVFTHLPEGKIPTQMVFITVDPEYDSSEQMQSYLKTFNPEFVGVTGDEEALEKLRKQLGILAMKNMNADLDIQQDVFDHSGTVILINPKGQFHGLFSMPHSADSIVTDFGTIQKIYS